MRKLILVSILFLVAPLAIATTADKMVFYGEVNVITAIIDQDKEFNGTYDGDTDTTWDLADARLGFDFKLSDALSAKVEIWSGLFSSNLTRHWYGAWKFSDSGTFMVGRTWAPTYQSITNSNLIDGAADIQGSLREDGLQLWFDVGGGNLKIAMLTPASTAVSGVTTFVDGGDPAVWGDDTDTILPKLEVSYDHNFAMVDANFFGGYNSYDQQQNQIDGKSISIDSWVLGATAAVEFKPVYFKAGIYFGQNLKEYGWQVDFNNVVSAVVMNDPADPNNPIVIDTDYLGYVLVLGFNFNDRFSLETGYTHIGMNQDYTTPGGIHYKFYEGAAEYYIMATYQLADNVHIYPEIAILDCDDGEVTINGVTAETDRGSRSTYGIYWKINF